MELIKLSAIASTNTYLKEMCSKMQLSDGTVIWAETQTAGRGQRGTIWQSEPGKGLTFSLLKCFSEFASEDHIQVNIATSLGIIKALDQLKIPSVSIKWPNDIMSYNKKLCGVLIENQLKGSKLSSSIIGIGLNVNNRKFDDLPQAGSLYTATGKEQHIEKVLQLTVKHILSELDMLEETKFKELKEAYEARLFRKDKESVFTLQEGGILNGIIRGVSNNGNLQVEREDGNLSEFSLKEIELHY